MLHAISPGRLRVMSEQRRAKPRQVALEMLTESGLNSAC